MNVNTIIENIDEIESKRGISKDVIVESLKEALAKAYRRQIDVPDAYVRVDIDPDHGVFKLYHQFKVVPEVTTDELEVSIDDPRVRQAGLQEGDFLEEERDISQLGRAAAILTKNVLKQKTREAEKQAIYDEYADKLDEMVLGRIESVEDRFVVVNIGKTLALMPKSGQIPGERYIEDQTIKVVITEVNRESKGAQVLVSRSDAKLVKRLFEKEVPEIYQGIVVIKAIAREPGERTKMAVYSNRSDVDPIGACIGPRGSRVQVVIEELKGEKIDIFDWSDDLIELINNALAPAEIVAVFPSSEKKGLVVVVDDRQLSLAIGKKGKNAKLAVRLTNTRIDIKSVSDMEEAGVDYLGRMAAYRQQIHQQKLEREQEAKRKAEEAARLARETAQHSEEVVDADLSGDVVETEVVHPTEAVSETQAEVEEEIRPELTDEEENQRREALEEEARLLELARQKTKSLTPQQTYVSKFETLADASARHDDKGVRPKRHKDRDKDNKDKERESTGPRINTAELLKNREYQIKPKYTEEELEEIRKQQEEEANQWYKDDDIDFDEYDDYYDED